jgi:hypothetical protein
MARWAERAGLSVRGAKTFGSPDGEKGISVMVWSGTSQKTAHEISDGGGTGKRSAA